MSTEPELAKRPLPRLVELCSVSDDVEANMVLALMRSEDIEAISAVDTDPGVLPVGSSERVRILVLEEDLPRAQRALQEHRLRTRSTAVLLAAGSGTRMGGPKGLVSIGDRTLIEELVDAYSASLAQHIIVVVSPDSTIAAKVDPELAKVVRNPSPEKGPLSSLWLALDDLDPTVDAILLHPVDVPVFDSDLIDELIRRFEDGEGPILVPTWQGRRGHPVLFGRLCFSALRQASLDTGARQVLHEHPDWVREVATELPWVTFDLNTPEDLQRFREQYRPEAASRE